MYGSSYMNHTVKDAFLVIWGDQVTYFIEVGLEHRTEIYRNMGGGERSFILGEILLSQGKEL